MAIKITALKIDVYAKVSRNLKRLRTCNGWSQGELARELGVHQAMIGELERCGRYRIDVSQLVSWSESFGLSPEQFLRELLRD